MGWTRGLTILDWIDRSFTECGWPPTISNSLFVVLRVSCLTERTERRWCFIMFECVIGSTHLQTLSTSMEEPNAETCEKLPVDTSTMQLLVQSHTSRVPP